MNPLIQQIKVLDQEISENKRAFKKAKSELLLWLEEHIQIVILCPLIGFGIGFTFSRALVTKIASLIKFKFIGLFKATVPTLLARLFHTEP